MEEEQEPIQKLWQEVRDLTLGTTTDISHLSSPPTPLHFLRDYISPNKPCLISNAINHWPATTLWHSTPYLLNTLSSSTVSLHVTRNGHADALTPHPTSPSTLCFASAEVQHIPFPDALTRVLESGLSSNCVGYLQQQNDCLRSEYGMLGQDCDSDFRWASEAFGCLPEAVNLWIGNEMSETSFHKDHYENMYAVVCGEKHFLLLPPTDVHRMYIRDYPAANYRYSQNDCLRMEYGVLSKDCYSDFCWALEAFGCLPEAVNLWIGNEMSETWFHKDHYENVYAVVCGEKHFLLLPPTDVHRMYIHDYPAANYRYSQDTGEFSLELEEPVRHVPWCSVNPYPSPESKEKEMAKFPLYFNGPRPFEVTVKAGEILYLPSMWFHHVRQSPDSRGLTIAVNYWYDMRFDIKYAYFNFLQSLPHSMLCNPSSSGKLGMESRYNSSICSEDESSMSDFTASANDNLLLDPDDDAEK